MPLELIGAGFGRTGTLSLKAALEAIDLGPCHHMLEVFGDPGSMKHWHAAAQVQAGQSDARFDWERLLGRYRSTVDWPSCAFWRELAAAYPDAKVLLSVRDPERWYESAYETIYQVTVRARSSQDPADRERIAMVDSLVFRGAFEDRFEDRAFAIGIFERHNEEVKKTIPAERLLVYEVKQGWEPLCRFAGREVPTTSFPHVNSRDEFKAMTGMSEPAASS